MSWLPSSNRRKTRRVTDEEHALWKSVNRDTVPLIAPSIVMHAEPIGEEKSAAKPRVKTAPRVSEVLRPSGRGDTGRTAFFPKPADVDIIGSTVPGLDRATARSLRKGERAPDARLDLHGMTLDRAHTALRAFILASQQRGHRCVLVITGKGEAYRHGREPSDGHVSGTLKRDVPRWLRLPPLGSAIVGIFEAHQRHGGAGALYVYLKRLRD